MKKIILLIMAAVILCSCSSHELKHTEYGFAMDTEVRISVNEKYAAEAKEAMTLCKSYDKVFSRTDPESVLYKYNNGEGELTLEAEELIKTAEEMCEKSWGAFDPKIAPLTDLWDIKNRKVPPKEDEIARALEACGSEIDLGGIAKGYISMKARDYLLENGVDRAILDLGGNIAVIGEGFKIGVQDPFDQEKIAATITLNDEFAVTSGGYRRYFEYNGKRYHHILSPFTGQCAQSGLASVTIIAKDGAKADALSTAVYVLGREKGIELCKNEGARGILITDEGEIVEF